MKLFSAVAFVASGITQTTATDLTLAWKDCGDATTHAKITSFTPPAITLGTKATMIGTGSLDEDVSGASFDLEMSGALGHMLSCKGDASATKSCPLPLGTGSLTYEAMTFPLKKGTTNVKVSITLSPNIPAALFDTTTIATATGANGDKLFCLQIKTSAGDDVHPERAAMIEEINAFKGLLWKAQAQARFATDAPGASKDLCGVKGNHSKAIADGIARGEIKQLLLDADAPIPENFDSEQNWPHCAKIIGDIRDQSNCGCCWAFAGAEAASDRMCIATEGAIMLPLSAQDVCFNANDDGCGGGQIDAPWTFIKSTGAVTGGQYKGSGPFGAGFCSDFSLPHCHHHGPQGDDPFPAEGQPGCLSQKSPDGPKKCDAAAEAPHKDFANDKYSFSGDVITAQGEKGIQQMIMAGGPVETAFTVYSDFENYAGGIYHHVSGSMAGGHAVKMVGWGVENGVKYWKVANSWNPHWGEKGYFRIRRGNNEGGIEDGVTGSSPSSKWHNGGATTVVV